MKKYGYYEIGKSVPNINTFTDGANILVVRSPTDYISAAISSGISNTILVKSGHKINAQNSRAKYIIDSVHQSNQIIVD